MIGLKRGTVLLCRHQPEWEAEARNTRIWYTPSITGTFPV